MSSTLPPAESGRFTGPADDGPERDAIAVSFVPSSLTVLRTRAWAVMSRILSRQPLDFEEERKRLLFGPIVLIATAMLTTFGVFELATGSDVEGAIYLTVAAILAAGAIRIRWIGDGRVVYRGAAIVLALLFIYFGTLGDHPYRAVWPFTLPVFALFLTGQRFGMAISMVVLLAWLVLMWLPSSLTGGYDYDLEFIVQFTATYFTIMMIALFMEQVRAMYVESVQEHRKELELANQHLTISGERLRGMAMVDPLTGVANRRAIGAHLEGEVERAIRSSSSLSIALLDIDHFKLVNDTHGHAVGDEVLRECARRIGSSLRAYDRVGRYGGEEFLLVLPGADAVDASRILDRVRQECSGPITIDDLCLAVTVSIGVATTDGASLAPGDPSFPSQLVRLADRALYRAKDDGRNLVRAYA